MDSRITHASPAVLALIAIATFAPRPAAATAAATQLCRPAADGRLIVNKEELARRLLAKFEIGVSSLPQDVFTKLNPQRPYADILEHLDELCAKGSACSATDTANVQSMQGWVGSMLSAHGVPGLQRTMGVDFDVFFAGVDRDNAVLCLPDAEKNSVVGTPSKGETQQAADGGMPQKPSAGPTFALRVRGSPDDFAIPRSDAASFGAAKPATLSVVRDGVARTNTYQFTGSVGALVYDSDPDDQMLGNKLVLYGGVNRSDVRAFTGASKPASSDTVDVGVFATAFLPQGDRIGSVFFSLRPDYLWDRQDKSQILSLNARATPYVNGALNDFIFIGRKFISIEPVAELHLDEGRYVETGSNALAAKSPQYTRVGGLVGFNVLSENPNVPLSVSSTYTYLKAVSGSGDIGLFSNTLTWSLDQAKDVGVSLSYDNGVREDTAKREEKTNLSLTVKY